MSDETRDLASALGINKTEGRPLNEVVLYEICHYVWKQIFLGKSITKSSQIAAETVNKSNQYVIRIFKIHWYHSLDFHMVKRNLALTHAEYRYVKYVQKWGMNDAKWLKLPLDYKDTP